MLLTFWVAVPAKTEPREFFRFLQQQGYLRVWLDGEVVRADPDKKIRPARSARPGHSGSLRPLAKRTARGWSRRSRPRSASARTGSTSFVDPRRPKTGASPFSTGWHCAHCDLDIRPPTPGLFSFNNPLGACPNCRGFGRTIAIDLNRAIPDRSADDRRQGRCAFFADEEIGRIAKGSVRACAREEIDVRAAFRGTAEGRSGFRHQRRSAGRGHRRRRTGGERSLVRRAGILQMAREQDLQNARARAAQPLSRLHHLSRLPRRPLPAGGAELPDRLVRAGTAVRPPKHCRV